MKRQKRRFCAALMGAFSAFCLLWGCDAFKEEPIKEGDGGTKETIKITFLKAGKADAAVILLPDKTAVIDTAEDDDTEKIVDFLEKNEREKIDILIITHFDKDHVGGAAQLLEEVPVKRILVPNYEGNNQAYEDFADAMDTAGLTAERITKETSIHMRTKDVKLVINPSHVDTEEDNEMSLVISLYHGKNSFLFAADAEGRRLEELLLNKIGSYDLLKVPHHGREDYWSEAFFEMVKPAYAIITASDKNLPENEVLNMLEQVKARVYITKDGNITCTSDGIKIDISQ